MLHGRQAAAELMRVALSEFSVAHASGDRGSGLGAWGYCGLGFGVQGLPAQTECFVDGNLGLLVVVVAFVTSRHYCCGSGRSCCWLRALGFNVSSR